jgi:primary-amine oxidase
LIAAHPMDALTPDEIRAAARILRAAGKLGETGRLVSLTLEENPKPEVRAWTRGRPFGRHAFAVLLAGRRLAEAPIELTAR